MGPRASAGRATGRPLSGRGFPFFDCRLAPAEVVGLFAKGQMLTVIARWAWIRSIKQYCPSAVRLRRMGARRLTMVGLLVLVSAAVGVGCGSDAKTVTAVVGGAAVTTPSTAPTYCKTLISSKSLLGLSAAMDDLAAHPSSSSARRSIRAAAQSVEMAAGQTSGTRAAALHRAAGALRSLAAHGFGRARRVQEALRRAGHLLESPCSFPVS
jgi:hypothetical protein